MDKGESKQIKWVAIGFRVLHIGLCAFMCVAAVDALERKGGSIDETDTIFVAAYIFLFALIFGVFEITQFKPVAAIDALYRANFGFLYKPMSKGVFLIFIGFLQFGLKNTFGLACGILTIACGIVLQLVYCKDPNLLIDVGSYTPPHPTARQQEV